MIKVQLHNLKTDVKELFFYTLKQLILANGNSICKKFNIKQEIPRVPFSGQETKMWHILSTNTESYTFW